jgi:type II secretory pathway pseudopilin PulG
MFRQNGEKGTITLEVIAALVLFALAAAGLAVALPMAFDRAAVWSDQQTLAWFLERNLEEWRSLSYAELPFGAGTYVTETLNGKTLECAYQTTVAAAAETGGQSVWSPLAVPDAAAPEHGLLATYYNSGDFSGSTFTRIDAAVNFSGSPDSSIDADVFSGEWTGFIEAAYSESYTFYTASSAGAWLCLNDTVVINNLTAPLKTENSGTVTLEAGKKYKLTLRLVESGSTASGILRWKSNSTMQEVVPTANLYHNLPKQVVLTARNPTSGNSCPGTLLIFPPYQPGALKTSESDADAYNGLYGLYFNSVDFSSVDSSKNAITTVGQLDPGVDFDVSDWGVNKPVTGVGPDDFSVRWTGYITPTVASWYRFYLDVTGGVRLWVNNTNLIDSWNTASYSGYGTSGIYLAAHQMYPITMDFRDRATSSKAILQWQSNSESTTSVIPKTLFYPSYCPVEDTYVDSQNKTANYGAATNLNLSYSSPQDKVYLKFKVTGLIKNKIPVVRLRLYSQGNNALNFRVKKIDVDSWNEKSVTYNSSVAEGSTVYGAYNGTPGKGFFEVDLDPSLLSGGNGTYGLELEPLTGCSGSLCSRETEYIDTLDYSPRLSVYYTRASDLALYYLNHETSDSSQNIDAEFKIVNNGITPIDLSTITVRYWYTRETAVTQITDLYWAMTVSGDTWTHIEDKVASSCVALTTGVSGANYYLQISFADDLILPAGAYVYWENRIRNYDWSYYTQSNDYSYSTITSYGENDKITLYVNGDLTLGTEP